MSEPESEGVRQEPTEGGVRYMNDGTRIAWLGGPFQAVGVGFSGTLSESLEEYEKSQAGTAEASMSESNEQQANQSSGVEMPSSCISPAVAFTQKMIEDGNIGREALEQHLYGQEFVESRELDPEHLKELFRRIAIGDAVQAMGQLFDPVVTKDVAVVQVDRVDNAERAFAIKRTSVLRFPDISPRPTNYGVCLQVERRPNGRAWIQNASDYTATLAGIGEWKQVTCKLEPWLGLDVPEHVLNHYAYNGKPLVTLLADRPATTDASTTP